MRNLLSAVFCAAMLIQATAQQQQSFVDPGHLTCKTHEHDKELMLKYNIAPTDPALLLYEQWMHDYTANRAGERGGVYIIPIVFHIVHAGGIENISDAQVYDALAILNRDFRKLNADTTAVVPAFKSLVADCEIEFRLAQKDALGNCVSGITRTYSVETFVGEDAMVDDVNLNLNNGTSTSNIRFPRDKYLNIWICANPSGAAGYTSTPFWAALNADYDGIWISHAYLGSIGTSSTTTSRALTHEIGHWLNLSHVWGNSNSPGVSCGDDGVNDTPETEGWQSCSLAGATCGNVIDNVQNYMEYSYCSRMFTTGQKSRMHAALNSTIAQRNNLWSASNLVLTGTDGTNYLCAADFEADDQVICAGDSVAFSDFSFHAPSGWTWTFPGGMPASSSLQSPVVTYNTPGIYNVTLSVTDGTTNVSTTKTGYIHVISNTGMPVPYFQNFEAHTPLPNNEFYLENADGQQEWEWFTGAGSSGNKCLKLDNFNNLNGGTKDAFVSTTLNLSSLANITFSFWAAYTKKTGSETDILRVSISDDCGNTWLVKKLLNATAMSSGPAQTTAFTPTTQWLQHFVTGISSSYLVPGFRFKFEFQSDLGNNVYIDDINITGPLSTEEVEPTGFSFSLVPNPAETEVAINLTSSNASEVNIQITDMSGRIVFENKNLKANSGMNTFYVPLEVLSKGMYLVNVSSETGSLTEKLIKK